MGWGGLCGWAGEEVVVTAPRQGHKVGAWMAGWMVRGPKPECAELLGGLARGVLGRLRGKRWRCGGSGRIRGPIGRAWAAGGSALARVLEGLEATVRAGWGHGVQRWERAQRRRRTVHGGWVNGLDAGPSLESGRVTTRGDPRNGLAVPCVTAAPLQVPDFVARGVQQDVSAVHRRVAAAHACCCPGVNAHVRPALPQARRVALATLTLRL